jgi:hypothetical protein
MNEAEIDIMESKKEAFYFGLMMSAAVVSPILYDEGVWHLLVLPNVLLYEGV